MISKAGFSSKVLKIDTGIEVTEHPVDLSIIEFVKLNGPVPAFIVAKHFGTSPHTARKWLRRAVVAGRLALKKQVRITYRKTGAVNVADVFYAIDSKKKRR